MHTSNLAIFRPTKMEIETHIHGEVDDKSSHISHQVKHGHDADVSEADESERLKRQKIDEGELHRGLEANLCRSLG
jgi:hypothetical protein